MKFGKLLWRTILNQVRLGRDRYVLECAAANAEGCRIDPRALIRIERGATFRLGKSIVIGAFSIIAVESNRNILDAHQASLTIGDFTYIGESNNIRASGGVTIGRNCLISQGVSIISSNHSSALGLPITDQPSRIDRMGVVIEDDVWIGTNSTILPGVTIGTGAIVAAGSVVTSSVANNTIVAGVPARFLKERT
jgi:acetyltransferase-like isoleucine patch superfamily enzyme